MNTLGKFLVFILIVGSVFGAAGSPQGQAAAAQPQAAELVLVLDLPTPESLPGEARPDGAQAARWARERAAPALQALQGLQAQGEVQSFRFDAQELAVHVTLAGSAGAAPERLRALPHVAAVIPLQEFRAYPVSYAQALTELFAQAGASLEPVPDLPQITNPSIYVFALEGNPYSYVRGITNPNIPVLVTARRGSVLMFSRLTTSEADGSYRVSPEWSGGVYAWRLLPGDVVTVSANGSTVNLTVVRLVAWMDPEQDAMLGYTGASLPLLAILEQNTVSDPCADPVYQDLYHGGTAAEDGSFLVTFYDASSQPLDLPYGITGKIEAFDLNGNYTWGRVRGFSIRLNLGESSTELHLIPGANLTASLKRGATVLQTVSGKADYDGWFYADFNYALQVGDVVSAVSGAATITSTVAPLVLNAAPATDTLSGVTGADQVVVADIVKPGAANYFNYSLPFPTACNTGSGCLHTQSTAAGEFTLSIPFDLQRGDALLVRVIEPSGKEQYRQLHVPLVAARPALRSIVGYWVLGDAPVRVEVQDSGGAPVASLDTASAGDGYFAVSTPALLAGYTVTVRDGSSGDPLTSEVLSMQIAALTAESDTLTETVKGDAPASNLVLMFQDYRPATNTTFPTCMDAVTQEGDYSFDLAAAGGIEAADEATVYSQGADGHITSAYSHAFQLSVEVNSGTLSGFTPRPSTDMTVRLLDSVGAVVEEAARTSNEAGTFNHTFAAHPLAAGQRVEVAIVDGAANGITLPPLSVIPDEASQSISGLSGASQPGTLTLYQWYSCDGTCARTKVAPFTADSLGAYFVSFAGQTWWDGTPVEVCGACVSTRLSYFTAEEHKVALQSADPEPVAADAYEDDNSLEAAEPYHLFSRHTFHDEADQDWMRLDVSAAQAGKTILIETFNLGLLEDTVLWVYDDRGFDLLTDDDSGEGSASRILFTPERAGTYYVQVLPFDYLANTGNCGATYDLLVGHTGVLLPLVLR